MSSNDIFEIFSDLKFDETWSFDGCTQKHTKYITHGYHRYPAKFIPQLAARLIKELTDPNDFVVDPFMGSGTTLVESKVLGRPSVGVDINPVAYLISKAKVNAINPHWIDETYKLLINNIYPNKIPLFDSQEGKASSVEPKNDRIDYWFKPQVKKSLSRIYSQIIKIENDDIKTFFLCGFSNILKNCSIWLQKSNKPTRDFKKLIPDPLQIFNKHIRLMIKKNQQFWDQLHNNGKVETSAIPYLGDSRKVPVKNNSISLVVTSPPYVTSYEYADLHQLTALWFNYTNNISEFRKVFIGSAHNDADKIIIGSTIGEKTIDELKKQNTGKNKEVAIYFSDMRDSFIEMQRYLKKKGKACIVIGDTAFKKVPVLNAEIFVDQMMNIGFNIYKIIKRRIPSKILPQTRNPQTGRFTSSNDKNKVLAYPYEYIIIMENK